MLMAAQAMKGGLAILKPHLASDSAANKGTVVIGTVKGDLHDIGKNLVALSALLTTTMPAMEATVNAVKEAGLATKTIIGGAPVTQAYADQIGADGYSDDAPGAVEMARSLRAA
jgi:5-methyltetrahydrofolate--homocysteine methyltransferase